MILNNYDYRQRECAFWTEYLPSVIGYITPTYPPTTEVRQKEHAKILEMVLPQIAEIICRSQPENFSDAVSWHLIQK